MNQQEPQASCDCSSPVEAPAPRAKRLRRWLGRTNRELRQWIKAKSLDFVWWAMPNNMVEFRLDSTKEQVKAAEEFIEEHAVLHIGKRKIWLFMFKHQFSPRVTKIKFLRRKTAVMFALKHL